MNVTEPRLPRGMRDLLPGAMRRRQMVVDMLRELFETFGFEPLDTPAVELSETLLGKYGADSDRLIYRASLQDTADLGLRFDHTVPLARVCATYDGLPRPFRRYQIGRVWRGERPQRGRYREFVQADVDIVGSASMLADAEIIALVLVVLDRLGFTENTTKVNNRKLLTAIGRFAGVPDTMLPGLYRAIDKLDRVGLDGVRLELLSVGLPADLLNRQRQGIQRWMGGQADRQRLTRDLTSAVSPGAPAAVLTEAVPAYLDALAAIPTTGVTEAALSAAQSTVMSASIAALRSAYPASCVMSERACDRLLDLLQLAGGDRALLHELSNRLDDPLADEGLSELGAVLDSLAAAGVPESKLELDCSMVRGLEYYTGTIFETTVTRPPIGSITGGGRFDHLVSMFGRDLPAVGTSFGVDRLVEVMDEVGLFPAAVDQPTASTLVTRFDDETTAAAVALAAELRSAGIKTELYYSLDGLGNQIRYALRRGIRCVLILGPDELAAGEVTVRDLVTKRQERVGRAAVADQVRRIVDPGRP